MDVIASTASFKKAVYTTGKLDTDCTDRIILAVYTDNVLPCMGRTKIGLRTKFRSKISKNWVGRTTRNIKLSGGGPTENK